MATAMLKGKIGSEKELVKSCYPPLRLTRMHHGNGRQLWHPITVLGPYLLADPKASYLRHSAQAVHVVTPSPLAGIGPGPGIYKIVRNDSKVMKRLEAPPVLVDVRLPDKNV